MLKISIEDHRILLGLIHCDFVMWLFFKRCVRLKKATSWTHYIRNYQSLNSLNCWQGFNCTFNSNNCGGLLLRSVIFLLNTYWLMYSCVLVRQCICPYDNRPLPVFLLHKSNKTSKNIVTGSDWNVCYSSDLDNIHWKSARQIMYSHLYSDRIRRSPFPGL